MTCQYEYKNKNYKCKSSADENSKYCTSHKSFIESKEKVDEVSRILCKIEELQDVVPSHLASDDKLEQIELLIQHFRYFPETATNNVKDVKEHFESLKF